METPLELISWVTLADTAISYLINVCDVPDPKGNCVNIKLVIIEGQFFRISQYQASPEKRKAVLASAWTAVSLYTQGAIQTWEEGVVGTPEFVVSWTSMGTLNTLFVAVL